MSDRLRWLAKAPKVGSVARWDAAPIGVAENHDGELGVRADAEPLYLLVLLSFDHHS